MRFSIRDLLRWTTITAIYAALAGALDSHGLLSFKGSFLGSCFLVAVIVFFALRHYYALARSGQSCLSFQRKQSYWDYAVLFGLPGAITGMWIVMNEPIRVSLVIFLYSIMIEADLLGERIVLGRLGVAYQFDFYSWGDHHFQIDPKTNRLHIKALSNAARKGASWDINLDIPADRVEEVRAILEAKQGATDAKTE